MPYRLATPQYTLAGDLFSLWLGWQDLNLRMRESKSRALPLGDTPTCILYVFGVSSGIRTHDLQGHNLAL